MKLNQLLFIGTFQRHPECGYIRTLWPDIRLRLCTDLSQLPTSLETSVIITSINWLEALSEYHKELLTQKTKKCSQWIGISDPGCKNEVLLYWLESGVKHLLPPEFEQPLSQLLTYYQPDSEEDQRVVLLIAESEKTTSRFEKLLQKHNIKCFSVTRNDQKKNLPDNLRPDLIVAIDGFGTNQAKILKSQQSTQALPVIYLTEASPVQDTHCLSDTYALVPTRLTESLLPSALKQFQLNKKQQQIESLNSQYLTSIQQLTQVLGHHAIISTTNRAGKFTYTNNNFRSISGYSQTDLVGQTHRILKSDKHSKKFYKDLWHTIKNGQVWHGIICNRHKSGRLYWICSHMLPIRNSNGRVQSYTCISSDISSLQRHRSLLQQFDHLMTKTQDYTHLAPWILDIKSRNICCSMLASRVLEFKDAKASLNCDQLLQIIHPDDRKRAKSALIYSIKHRNQFEIELRIGSPDGSQRWFCITGLPIHNKNGQPVNIQGTLEDITTQKIAQEKISGSLNLFRQMFNTSDYCMAIADPLGTIVFINPAYSRVMGYSSIEAIGRNCRELLCCDAQIATELVETLLREKKNWRGTTKRRRKDGTEFISLNLAGPILNESGTISHLYITFTDITQELQNNQELTQAKVSAEQANRTKSEFLSRMSHELRTPMNSVLGFAQLLQKSPELPSVLHRDVREITTAGHHLLQLINDLLDLSKIESGHISLAIEPVSLKQIITECKALLHPMAQTRQIKLLSENIQEYQLFADRLRLKQVILNLLTNAIIYSPPGEEVKIKPLVLDNNRIRIEFIDNGPGIPASLIDELFIPFKRLDQTSAKVEGSGIGLTISQELVELMSGEIGVNSQPGTGSVFWFELPADSRPASHRVRTNENMNISGKQIIDNEFETHLL